MEGGPEELIAPVCGLRAYRGGQPKAQPLHLSPVQPRRTCGCERRSGAHGARTGGRYHLEGGGKPSSQPTGGQEQATQSRSISSRPDRRGRGSAVRGRVGSSRSSGVIAPSDLRKTLSTSELWWWRFLQAPLKQNYSQSTPESPQLSPNFWTRDPAYGGVQWVGTAWEVERMLEEGRECRDVVTQISAATKALEQAGFRLVGSRLLPRAPPRTPKLTATRSTPSRRCS
jgi:hypothetical protein